ncbi:glycosyltransferase family 4 protein [Microbacterium testaceum]|uniref:glycosyltransferase family 4 protein n=1 Tax=Microbacterium testaceum TaxID=2033 RepID=UPI002AC39401|nr:glycosyltransferase family 4 protein [Microbacterium testaceum]MDZ5146129.1 glycosyltransferase family 4 protein [Microbacterium testaceum]
MHIVSFTRSVPYPGIPHAGGEYYLRHVAALRALGHRVTIVAPRTPENEHGAELAPNGVILYGQNALPLHASERLLLRFNPATVTPRERRSLSETKAVFHALSDADVVEYQWTQAATLHRSVGRLLGRPAKRMLVLHDVMTQQISRQRDDAAASPVLRLQRAIKLALVRRTELRAVRGADIIVVFSQKDAGHVRALSPESSAAVRVVRPPLAHGTHLRREVDAPLANGRTLQVLMVGWFRRSDNVDAALWLCREVWPLVRDRAPEARLVLAGADPTEDMRIEARLDPSIEVTGYLNSLDEQYHRANVVAVPLQQGAGVKFKTVVAMLWGIPVVSTAVGLEGVTEDPRRVWREAEDPADFAEGLLAVLESPTAALKVAENARWWATEEFSESKFRDALRELLEPADPYPNTPTGLIPSSPQ